VGLDDLKNGSLRESIVTAKALGNGFILTALLWSSALAMAIDRRLNVAALLFAIAGAMTLFGVIHSPLDTNAVFFPIELPGLNPDWVLAAEDRPLTFQFAVAYFVTAGLLAAWAWIVPMAVNSEA
jgi:AGZA family xanthine/uracil permease-like MFS transporter